MQTLELKKKLSPVKNKLTPKKGKNWFSKLNAWLHLWPSLVSGIIVVFVCFTGTIIVYCDEILDFTAADAKYVEVGPHKACAEDIIASIHQKDPKLRISQLVFFSDPHRSVRARAFHQDSNKLNFIYINPYSAEVLKIDYSGHFFYVMAHLHSNLMNRQFGGWVVLIATLIFFVSCVTGLILWWPKSWTKRTRQDSFTVKWKARFKRLH